jgi:acetoin utilization protein AcuB
MGSSSLFTQCNLRSAAGSAGSGALGRIRFAPSLGIRNSCAIHRATSRARAGTAVAFSSSMNARRASAVHQYPAVRQYMTTGPHTIGPTRSLATAHKLMRQHQVRHLPVLDGGRIVGLVSERDLAMVESLPGVNPTDVRVEEAMVPNVFTVAPDTPIGEVIETMIARKLGSAVITERGHVVGVFTTIDALVALHELLEQR